MESVIPKQEALGCIRNLTEHEPGNKSVKSTALPSWVPALTSLAVNLKV